MTPKRQQNTYSVLYYFVLSLLLNSFLVRLTLLLVSFSKVDLNLLVVCRIFAEGLLFDTGVASFFVAPYAIYLLILPAKWNASFINKLITITTTTLAVFILMFSFFAEFTFWQEFESRFNFIAVDYLIYTYEVIENINESYPLPLLIGGMLAITLLVILVFFKRRIFSATFHGTLQFVPRLVISLGIVLVAITYALMVDNGLAESGRNRYQNELAKAGIYSFFSAFKKNELNYEEFYRQEDSKKAFAIVRERLKDQGTVFGKDSLSIKRTISSSDSLARPNVIMITIESLSADFLRHFGNTEQLTPVLDSIADKSILFTNMYATGARTVRGMEALSLSIPPTPGNSIVRRSNNEHLATVGHIFREHGYETGFFYGGDGYFDNMNSYFGNNGFAITDRGRKILVSDKFATTRNIIPDSLVHFENAWGICDEDLYDAVIRDADSSFDRGKLFYNFVMTTSNHRPFTFPSGKIDIQSGSGREGAVKYTDYAIGQFLSKIKGKPWFKNTLIIFIADHCANSAGKNEIDITKYHIPAIVYNPADTVGAVITKMCSQIDLYPTLFSSMHWSYTSCLFGRNVLSDSYEPRILVGTYQKLAYMKNDSLVILSPQRKVETYQYRKDKNEQIPMPPNKELVAEAVAYYQTAYCLFKHGGLRE